VNFNEKNISAKEETCTDGARLQKENVYKKRKKGFGKTPCKGQKAAFLLSSLLMVKGTEL
jgi:hypothetical protein